MKYQLTFILDELGTVLRKKRLSDRVVVSIITASYFFREITEDKQILSLLKNRGINFRSQLSGIEESFRRCKETKEGIFYVYHLRNPWDAVSSRPNESIEYYLNSIYSMIDEAKDRSTGSYSLCYAIKSAGLIGLADILQTYLSDVFVVILEDRQGKFLSYVENIMPKPDIEPGRKEQDQLMVDRNQATKDCLEEIQIANKSEKEKDPEIEESISLRRCVMISATNQSDNLIAFCPLAYHQRDAFHGTAPNIFKRVILHKEKTLVPNIPGLDHTQHQADNIQVSQNVTPITLEYDKRKIYIDQSI